MKRFSGVALVILGLSAAMPAIGADKTPSAATFPGVTNSSFIEPSGDRAIRVSVEVPASARDAFAAFATTEGFRRWAAPVARVDLRVGGEIEASYDAKAALGDADNIRNRIDAYLVDRLLVIHNVQAPKALPGRAAFARTATVIEFAPVSADRTRVTVTNIGYGTGAEADAAYRHFEWGNAYTLDALRRHFAAGTKR